MRTIEELYCKYIQGEYNLPDLVTIFSYEDIPELSDEEIAKAEQKLDMICYLCDTALEKQKVVEVFQSLFRHDKS